MNLICPITFGFATFISSQFPNLKFEVIQRLTNYQILNEAVRRTDPEGKLYFTNIQNAKFVKYLTEGFENDPIE